MDALDAQVYMSFPPDFVNSADVLLILNDKKTAKAYAQILASRGAVLSNLLEHLTTSTQAHVLVSVAEARVAARFAHKFDSPHLAESADVYLSWHAIPFSAPASGTALASRTSSEFEKLMQWASVSEHSESGVWVLWI
ncbi:hypothetical protein WJX81_005744 [Elliptochloris bilobata]|uniref:Uncharacterized protein n=1 Tax=Elliptochloris bilobata TaxID=381761 RepID=A0AAW1SHX5_9CHLO